MKLVAPVVKSAKNFVNKVQFRARFTYAEYRESLPIDENAILIESFNGDDISGAPFYLLKELCENEEYAHLKKFVAVKKRCVDGVNRMLGQIRGTSNPIVVVRHGDQYCKLLASAKYLINNVTFPTYFIKRDSQIYLNTWHGTPLKALGRSMRDKPNTIGNVQRNFLMSDYLLCPSKFVWECISKDYMIDIFYQGKYVFEGYPQNAMLLSKTAISEVSSPDDSESTIDLKDKKVVVYMPTWRDREAGMPSNAAISYLSHALLEFERRLDDNTIVLVKPHHLASGEINWAGFSKVLPFPDDVETYQVLSAADILITDYSSVMFDFLDMDREILLYTYDEKEYMSSRSTYRSIQELPFWHTSSTVELCEKINEISDCHHVYSDIKAELCRYDHVDSSRRLCRLLINGDEDDLKILSGSSGHNGKKNVLIYAGSLLKNGITASLTGLLNTIDTDEANYVLLFYGSATRNHTDVINSLPPTVRYIAIQGQQTMTVKEAVSRYRYFRMHDTSSNVLKDIDTLFAREKARICPTCHFDKVIHFTGYERQIIHVLNAFDDADKYIYVHNDMMSEYRTRGNFDLVSTKYAYRNWSKIAVVRESLKPTIAHDFGVSESKIAVVHNCNSLAAIRGGANEPLQFDSDTTCTVPFERLQDILGDASTTVFINVARFSPEKGQMRLIKAFEKYLETYNRHSCLIIVGGHGKQYEEIAAYVEAHCSESVILIKSLSNPYPLIAQSNAMVLSSYYEGLPMVIFEALILGTPVISTDIDGPREFLSQGYGLLVDDSEEGIVEGLIEFDRTGLKDLREFDPDGFNVRAADEFRRLIEL